MSGITGDIQEVCASAGISLQDLNAVAVSAGPGSYTGLRIGTSVAKGLCHALRIPLIAISTLEAMIDGVRDLYTGEDVLFCPLIDARRMEVYTMAADAGGNVVAEPMAYVLDSNTFSFIPEGKRTIIFGSGAEKCTPLLQSNYHWEIRYNLSSTHLHTLANRQFIMGVFANLPYFEPQYIKDFYTPAKKQV